MTAVQYANGVLSEISGNPTILRLDGQVNAPLVVLLQPSWTDAERAEYGIYIAVPFVVPDGYEISGVATYAFRDGSGNTIVDQTFPVQLIPSQVIFGDSRATTGTAILDYGVIPTFSASVFVDGQTNILATSKVQVWFQADTTDVGAEYNSASDHLLASQYVKLTSGEPVVEDGFLIFAESRKFLWSGKYRVRWSWSQ